MAIFRDEPGSADSSNSLPPAPLKENLWEWMAQVFTGQKPFFSANPTVYKH